MAEYGVCKGIMKPLEFKGLRAKYILLALVGCVGGFIVYMIFSFFTTYVGLVLGGLVAAVSIITAVVLNSKFGANGLDLYLAGRNTVKYISNNRRIHALVKNCDKEQD